MNDPSGPVAEITITSSGWGIITTVLGLIGLGLFAAAVIALNGLTIVTGVIAVAAVAATVVLALDVPVAATFGAAGIRRSTPLRRQQIEWVEVERLVRLRRGGIRRPGSARSKGIVAVTRGGRRTILVDRTETAEEHHRLRAVLAGALVAHDRYDSLDVPSSAP